MQGVVTNLRASGNGYVEVTITSPALATINNGQQQMIATVQMAAGTEPRLGATVEVTLVVVG